VEPMPEKRTFALFGASGHAKVILDILEKSCNTEILGLFDDDAAKHGSSLLGYTVLGGRTLLLEYAVKNPGLLIIISIGIISVRIELARWFADRGIRFGVAVHPSAQIGKHAVMGPGTVVMATAVVNPDTKIGDHVIINTGAVVDHDCVIGHGVHIAPGVAVCGGVTIGERTLVGVGAKILPGTVIGANVVVGGGAVVTKPVAQGTVVVGCPAEPVSSRRGRQEKMK